MQHMYSYLVNFNSTAEPVDPKKLRVKGGRKIDYLGNTYIIKNIDRSNRKNKKYVASVLDNSTNKIKNIHWGNTNYDDYYVHKDKKRRENFKARHGAIKLKDGTLASKDPRQPSYYAMNANWSKMNTQTTFSYMSSVASFLDELASPEQTADRDNATVLNQEPMVVKRLGRFNNLKNPSTTKIKRQLTTAQMLDLRQGEYE